MASVAMDAGARSHITMDFGGVKSNVLEWMFAISVFLLMNQKQKDYEKLVSSREILAIQVTVKTDKFPDGETQSVVEWLLRFGKSTIFLISALREIFWNHSLGGNYTDIDHAFILEKLKEDRDQECIIDKEHFIHLVVNHKEASTVGHVMLIAYLEPLRLSYLEQRRLSDKSSTKA